MALIPIQSTLFISRIPTQALQSCYKPHQMHLQLGSSAWKLVLTLIHLQDIGVLGAWCWTLSCSQGRPPLTTITHSGGSVCVDQEKNLKTWRRAWLLTLWRQPPLTTASRDPPSPFKDCKVKNAHNILLLRLMVVPVLLIVLQVAAETNSFAFTRPSTGS